MTPAWTILSAFAGALLVLLLPARMARVIALAASLVGAMAAAISCLTRLGNPADPVWSFDRPWIPSLGVRFHLAADGLSLTLLLLTGIVAVAGVLFSWNVERRPRAFFAFFLTIIGGVYGVFLSRDAFLLFVCYEIVILPKYMLIAIWGSTHKEYGAMKLTMYSIGASALILIGLVVAYAAAVSLSPIHIGLLLLMLLGPNPIQRGSWFVLSWMATIGGVVLVVLTVGHNLLLTMDQGSAHRTGLDLLAAGALLALGIKELLERREEGDEPPGWTRQLNRFSALPLPLLIAAGVGIELASPDDLFLFAKSAGAILATGLSTRAELAWVAGFTLVASLVLLLPLLAVAIRRDRVLPLLEGGKQLLFARGDLLVGLLSLALAAYLGWEGIAGLRAA